MHIPYLPYYGNIWFKILEKIPYMLIVGDKEAEDKKVSVRSRKDGDLGVMSIEDLTNKLIIEDRTKKI